MANGTVKWFSPKKGYGFITMEDGQEVFVHYSAIDGSGFRSLEQGERVEFEVAQGPKGLQASNVNKDRTPAGRFPEKGGTEGVMGSWGESRRSTARRRTRGAVTAASPRDCVEHRGMGG